MEEVILGELLRVRVHAIPAVRDWRNRMDVLGWIIEGGIRSIELLLPGERGLDFLEEAVREFGKVASIGAGSVVTKKFARAAIDRGAAMIVTPIVAEDVVAEVKSGAVVCMCGAQTPTEMHRAVAAGADLVKLFPANAVSPSVLKTIRVPLPDLRIITTGGITPRNAPAYIRAGATAVAAGRYLGGAREGSCSRARVLDGCERLLASVRDG